MSEKLSIVIPAYNEEKNIAKCINELQATCARSTRFPTRSSSSTTTARTTPRAWSGPRWPWTRRSGW